MSGEDAGEAALLIVLGVGIIVGLYLEVRDAVGYEHRLGRKIRRGLLIVAAAVSRVGVPFIVFATDALWAGPALARLNLWLAVGCAVCLLVLSFLLSSAVRLRADVPYVFRDAPFLIRWFGICAAGYLVLRHFHHDWGIGPIVAFVYWLGAMAQTTLVKPAD